MSLSEVTAYHRQQEEERQEHLRIMRKEVESEARRRGQGTGRTRDFAFALLLDGTGATQLDIWPYKVCNERVFWFRDELVNRGYLGCQWSGGELDFDWLDEGHESYLLTRQQQWGPLPPARLLAFWL